MTDTTDTSRNWHLRWRTPTSPRPGLRHDPGQGVTHRVGSTDPHALKLFAAGQGWTESEVLEVSVTPGFDGVPCNRVHCRPADLARWSPDADPLPPDNPAARHPPGRVAARIRLLQDLRAGVDAAVTASVLGPLDAAGIMLLARDALDRHERAGRENPTRSG